MKANKFKNDFINDMTYGMLVVGASMEECFDHIFYFCDMEISKASIEHNVKWNIKKYLATFTDEEEEIELSVVIEANGDTIVYIHGDDYEWDIDPKAIDNFKEYCELNNRLAKWLIKEIKENL